jgi:threonine/homoserine/homoserine lactone efflux protein
MTFISWLTLIGVCALGAMSPGPSLAVILQNRTQRGLGDALVASWTHAAGIFLWALAASTTLGVLFQKYSPLKTLLTLAGAAFLVYLAFRSWKSTGSDESNRSSRLPAAWFTGLSISLLNPKIFVFFTALFSQLIPEQAGFVTLVCMAMVAGMVDGSWYTLVSLLVGHIGIEKSLISHGVFINRASACFYLVIAIFTLAEFTGFKL